MDPALLAPIAAAAPVPFFAPAAGAKIATREEDAGDAFEDGAADAVKALLARIRALHSSAPSAAGASRGATTLLGELGARLRPTTFEKDDDGNGHVDFLTSATNLRSFVYAIQPSTRFTVRLTAGRIIPAVATCTAAVTGLGMLELYKLLQVSFSPLIYANCLAFIILSVCMYELAVRTCRANRSRHFANTRSTWPSMRTRA